MRALGLPPRLRLIANWVPEGAYLADVGTDHGYLPTWLLLRGSIRGAIASDLRKGPLERAKASGAGGQHINKTSSAVRLIHKPTGIVVASQQERSQFQNKDNCMKQLRAKLIELKIQQHAEKISDIKGVQMKIEWGSQIRSYVFMPYQLVKDTRTGYETSQIDNVMDGDLDGFLNAYLTQLATGEGSNAADVIFHCTGAALPLCQLPPECFDLPRRNRCGRSALSHTVSSQSF